MQKVKIKVSMELRKHAQFNSKIAHHHVWSLKQVRKNLRKGSVLNAEIRPASEYSLQAVVLNGTPYPVTMFKILPA